MRLKSFTFRQPVELEGTHVHRVCVGENGVESIIENCGSLIVTGRGTTWIAMGAQGTGIERTEADEVAETEPPPTLSSEPKRNRKGKRT